MPSGCNLSCMDEDSLDNWFIREILVHEELLVGYLLRRWPSRSDVSDLRQDTYVRVYEAAAKSRPPAPKAFLFATAAHLLTDRIRRRRVVAIDVVADVEALNVLVEEVSPERRISAHEELRRLAQAIDLLPPRCREVVWLRRVDELPQREVAKRLGITEKSVEKHVMKGMKLLAAAFRGPEHMIQEESPSAGDQEKKHGEP